MTKITRDPFTGRMVRRLWWPAIMSAIGLSIGDIADALVIGNRMGEIGLTAVSICLPLYMIINVLIYGLGSGGSIRYSRLMAEGKPEEAGRSFNHILLGGTVTAAVIAAVLVLFSPQVIMLLGGRPEDTEVFGNALTYGRLISLSIPVFVISYILNYYLIADGHEKLAAFAFTVGNITDLSLNILLVLVLNMGVAGAALSTLFGQLLAIVLYMPAIFGRKRGTLAVRLIRIDFREVFSCFMTGFSTSVQFIGQFFFFMLVNRLLLNMSGENGVAVFDVVQNTSYVVMYLSEATVNALQPVVSTLCGEKNRGGMQDALRVGLLLTFASVAALSAIIFLKPEWICMLFGVREAESVAIGHSALRIFAVGSLFGAAGVVLGGYEQARGNEKRAALLTILRKAAVLFPCILLCARGGIDTIWWFFTLTEWISLAVYGLMYKRFAPDTNRDMEERIYRGTIHGTIDALPSLMSDIEAFCERWESSMKQQMVVNLVAEEICSAIVNKGFAGMKDGTIQLTLIAEDGGDFEFHIRDNAARFNPFALAEQKLTDAGEEMDVSAIGIQMIRKKVKQFYYRQYQGFNTLVVRV